jgi:hypothetical protein
MDTYSIVDLRGYATSIRDAAAKSFTETYTENLDEFISIEQVIGMVKENSIGQDEENNYLITEENFDELFEQVRDRLYSVGLSRLATKGFIECAWDDESNEMIFWLSDEGQTRINNRLSSKNEQQ